MIDARDTAARAAFTAAAGRRADELRIALDPAALPATTCEWTTRLVASLGCIACSALGDDLEACLIEHVADLLLWTDQIEAERERRAA